MSAVVVLTPVVAAAWPIVSAAAAGALASLGYAAAQRPKNASNEKAVTLEVGGGTALAEDARAEAGPLVFRKGDLTVEVSPAGNGGCRVRVIGCGRTEEDLRKAGREVVDRIAQQYAYHRLVSELRKHNFELVEEGVQEDRSIKIRVRQWKA